MLKTHCKNPQQFKKKINKNEIKGELGGFDDAVISSCF